jgi:hypothetical protein
LLLFACRGDHRRIVRYTTNSFLCSLFPFGFAHSHKTLKPTQKHPHTHTKIMTQRTTRHAFTLPIAPLAGLETTRDDYEDIPDAFLYRYYTVGVPSSGMECKVTAEWKRIAEFTTDFGTDRRTFFYPNTPACLRGCCPMGSVCSAAWLPSCGEFASTFNGTLEGYTPAAKHADGLSLWMKNDDVWQACLQEQEDTIVWVSFLVGGLLICLCVAAVIFRYHKKPSKPATFLRIARL